MCWFGCLPVWRKYTRTSVAPHCKALSTCSHRAEVVLLYPRSRSELMSVWPRKSGTLAPSFRARLTTVFPPLGAPTPQCVDGSGAVGSRMGGMLLVTSGAVTSDMTHSH